MTFKELGLSEDILKAITELGFEKPMPIQEKVIPILLEKNVDIVGLAQTGTGKTAAFGLPIIHQVDVRVKKPQVLILSPTRELCMQIAKDLTNYSKYVDGLRVLAVYGGANIVGQLNELKRGVQVIVATPGRLKDLMSRKAANLSNVFRVVLDEADEMLNMGFLDDINDILSGIPEDRNTMLFSATMPKEIQRIANKYMTDPVEIVAGTRGAGAENVKHLLYTVHAKDKYHALKRLADFYPEIYGIVFCRTRRETQEIADKLIQDGYNADSLHGDLSQPQRDYVMQKFRIRNIRLLVATDVAARGLDVNDLTHVIHYSLPDEKEVYTHRSGRTGRIGKDGISIAITHLREKYAVTQIEKLLGIKFIRSTMPTGREICEKQLFALIDKMENVEIDHSQIDTYLPVIYKKLEWLDKEELIKHFVSLEFNRFLDYYRDADDLSEPKDDRGGRGGRRDRDRGERGSRRERGERGERNERGGDRRSRQRDSDGKAESGYTRIFINLGKMDGLVPNGLIEMLNKNVDGPQIPVGRIDLMKKFSFFEVKSDHAKKLIKTLNKETYFRGSRVAVEVAEGKDAQEKKEFTKRVDGARKKRKRRFD